MTKFHVTKAGRTEPCGASVRVCPLGQANHYDNLAEAARAAVSEAFITRQEQVQKALANSGVHTDFGTYEWEWINGDNADEYDYQIQMLDDWIKEARSDGYESDANAYERLKETILEVAPRP